MAIEGIEVLCQVMGRTCVITSSKLYVKVLTQHSLYSFQFLPKEVILRIRHL